jgi:hypothetical protein
LQLTIKKTIGFLDYKARTDAVILLIFSLKLRRLPVVNGNGVTAFILPILTPEPSISAADGSFFLDYINICPDNR